MNGAELLVKTAIAAGDQGLFHQSGYYGDAAGEGTRCSARGQDYPWAFRRRLHRRRGRLRAHDRQACHDLVPPGSGLGKRHRQPPQCAAGSHTIVQRRRRPRDLAPCGKPNLSSRYRGPGCYRIRMAPHSRVGRGSLARRGGRCSGGFARANSKPDRAARLSSGRVE